MSCLSRRPCSAFTLVEIIIVVVIIGILAALSGPSFGTAIKRGRARDAINNLNVIHAAQQVYYVRNNRYINGGIGVINNGATGLGLNIIQAGNVVYNCAGAAANSTAGSCTATGAGTCGTATAVLATALTAGANPSCSTGVYP